MGRSFIAMGYGLLDKLQMFSVEFPPGLVLQWEDGVPLSVWNSPFVGRCKEPSTGSFYTLFELAQFLHGVGRGNAKKRLTSLFKP